MLLELRPVTSQDEPFLEGVYASSRAAELAALPWTPEQKRLFVRQQFLAQQHHYQTHFPGAAFQLVLVDGAQAGRLYRWEDERELRLLDITLLPEWQGLGLGTRLIRQLIREAASHHRSVTLHVLRSSRAVSLYLRLGFSVREEGDVYWCLECRDG